MNEKDYNVRVAVYETKNGHNAMVSFGNDNVFKMFPKPFVELKRMQDRIGFLPRDAKTKRGIVSVRADRIQFGLEPDCEKMKDFCGEYTEVHRTEAGVVFLRLSDRRDYTVTLPAREGKPVTSTPRKSAEKETPQPSIPETPEETPELEKALQKAIETETDKIKELADRLRELDEERGRIENDLKAAEAARDAYCDALRIASERKR